MTTKSRITSKDRVDPAALGAARTLQRRLRGRQLYRVRRDRKIAVDWLGREFTLSKQAGEAADLQLRLTSYDPDQHTVVLWPVDITKVGHVLWTTDTFWSHLRIGLLLPS